MKRFFILGTLVIVLMGVSTSVLHAQKSRNEKQIAKHAVSHEKMLERLLKYISVESWSLYNEENRKLWTMTDGQVMMADMLEEEARSLGADVYRSPDNYVYVTVPSNIDYDVPSVGISCHLDYTCEAPYVGIKPSVVRYEGGDIVLNDTLSLSAAALAGLEGKTIIHTDGTSVLGGDDKNGCTIVMSVLETLMKSDMKHGEVQLVWGPNEDIGLVAERIDTAHFKPDILYDLDAEGNAEVGESNFTGREFYLTFIGKAAHPGDAKAQGLGDALAAAARFVASIPAEYRPENSEDKQGYIQAYEFAVREKINWYVALRIRYFDQEDGEAYDRWLKASLLDVQKEFPNVGIKIEVDEIRYDNVEYSMHPACKSTLIKAAKKIGKELEFISQRGAGTSAFFTAKGLRGGLLVFSGQHNIHSVSEYSVLEEVHEAYMLMLHTIDYVSQMK